MQLSEQPYDSIHSNTNKISDKVPSTAINYQKELKHINKEDREYINQRLKELEKNREELNKKYNESIVKRRKICNRNILYG